MGALRVVVAGGGIAGLEAIAALRALAGGRVDIELLTPEPDFVYRPQSVAAPFATAPTPSRPLAHVAADFDVRLERGALERVLPSLRRAFAGDGREIAYDELVVAVGARRYPYWRDALTFRGPEDVEAMRELAVAVAGGGVRRLAFTLPPRNAWPLPAYELALLTVAHANAAGHRLDVLLATSERAPLEVFGEEAAAAVAELLADAGIELWSGVEVDVPSAHEVVAPSGERFEVDRVVALPILEGPAVTGLPTDERGFVPIDLHGRVPGVEHVFAAGDGVQFPVKQGGIATQQADAAAEVIAKRAGAAVDPRPFRPVLRGVLLTGARSRFLRRDLTSRARVPTDVAERPLWWPAEKVAGQHLSAYLGHREPEGPHGDGDVAVEVSFAERVARPVGDRETAADDTPAEPPPAHACGND